MRSLLFLLVPFWIMAATVTQSGYLFGWQSVGGIFKIDEKTGGNAQIELWWSSSQDGGIWVYGHNTETELSLSKDKTVSTLTGADLYPYSEWAVGPIYQGDLILTRNAKTDTYMAFDIKAIDTANGFLDIHWHLLGINTQYTYAKNPIDGKCNIFDSSTSLPSGWESCSQEEYEDERHRIDSTTKLTKSYIDSRPEGWNMVGTCSDDVDISIFSDSTALWRYDPYLQSWEKYAPGSDYATFEENFSLRPFEGFWLLN